MKHRYSGAIARRMMMRWAMGYGPNPQSKSAEPSWEEEYIKKIDAMKEKYGPDITQWPPDRLGNSDDPKRNFKVGDKLRWKAWRWEEYKDVVVTDVYDDCLYAKSSDGEVVKIHYEDFIENSHTDVFPIYKPELW